MDRSKLESVLRESLEDRRLSRDERYQLKALVGSERLDDETRAFVRNRVFDIAREAADQTSALDLLDWSQDAIKTLESSRARTSRVELAFSPGERCLSAIQRLLRQSQKSADICVFTITDDRLSSVIAESAKRGVVVRIISDNDKSEDTGSDVDRLLDMGISVRLDRSEHHMHHKFALFDDREVLTGSYNWTRSAASSNRENLLVTDDHRAVSGFRAEFDKLWHELG